MLFFFHIFMRRGYDNQEDYYHHHFYVMEHTLIPRAVSGLGDVRITLTTSSSPSHGSRARMRRGEGGWESMGYGILGV